MTTQLITPSRPAANAPGPARHRRIRTAAAVAGVAALIATGGYIATTTIGPDAIPRTAATGTGTDVNPSAQALREMHQSIAGQYGSQSAAGTVMNPSGQALREMHQSIAGQYGSRSAPNATVNLNAQVRRELRESIAGQYGPAR
jgi:hypothetical protein